jgi:hypothetical protein
MMPSWNVKYSPWTIGLDFSFRGEASLEEKEVVTQLFTQLGRTVSPAGTAGDMQKQQQTQFERMRFGAKRPQSLPGSYDGPQVDELDATFRFDDSSTVVPEQDDFAVSKTKPSTLRQSGTIKQLTVGSSSYTVRWESDAIAVRFRHRFSCRRRNGHTLQLSSLAEVHCFVGSRTRDGAAGYSEICCQHETRPNPSAVPANLPTGSIQQISILLGSRSTANHGTRYLAESSTGRLKREGNGDED